MRRRVVWVLLSLTCCNASEDGPSKSPADPVAVAPAPGAEAPPAAVAEDPVEPPADPPHLREVECVYLQPLGEVSAETTEIVREALATTYAVKLRTGPDRPLPEDAYYEPRKRYRADILLDHLDGWLPEDCDRIVGITHKDISTTKGKHEDWGILGLGSMPGSSCVVSSFRLRKKLGKVPPDERLARVAIHELGHTLGLPHCPSEGCLMEDAQGTVVTIDRETHLCELCLERLDWQGDPPPRRPSYD